MKIRNLFIVLAAITLFASCDKIIDTALSYRIKQVVYDNEGTSNDWKYIFTYEGEKLVKVTEYEKDADGNWVEYSKSDYSYSGENATITDYYYTNEWVIDEKYEYLIQNDLLMQELYYFYDDGDWINSSKWVYQYSGGNLTGYQSFYDYNEDGTLEEDYKGEYVYQNNKLTEYKDYEIDNSGNWQQYDREIITYNGDKLSTWTDYDLDESSNWIEMDKAEYQYSGNNISQINYFTQNDELTQWQTDGTKTFSYDSNDYLTEEITESGRKITYEYEEGTGNAQFFWYYPEDLVYGEPVLKIKKSDVRRKYIPYFQRFSNLLKH